MDTRLFDVMRVRSLAAAHGPVLTMPERQDRNDDITAKMYGLQIQQLRVEVTPAIEQEIHVVDLDYPLGHHARTLLRIGLDFVENIDDDVLIYKER